MVRVGSFGVKSRVLNGIAEVSGWRQVVGYANVRLLCIRIERQNYVYSVYKNTISIVVIYYTHIWRFTQIPVFCKGEFSNLFICMNLQVEC